MNRKIVVALAVCAIASSHVGAQEGTLFVEGDNVGIGVATPADRLHIASGLVRIGGHTSGERVGHPSDFQITGLRNVIYNIDSDSDSTNANFVVAINGDPNSVILQAREDRRIRFNGATPTTTHPLVVGTNSTNGNGAHLTAGGTWVNASSRQSKHDIAGLAADEAVAALEQLAPVKFRYLGEPDEQYVGFIAEDVPEIVAQKDRTTISSMDVVAVLTRVVQDQQTTIQGLSERLTELESELRVLRVQAP